MLPLWDLLLFLEHPICLRFSVQCLWWDIWLSSDFSCSIFYFSFLSCRVCFHYHPHCTGLWTLYPCGTCQSDQLFLGLEGHYLYLALLLSMGRSASPGQEQVHPRHAWTRVYCGLGIEECQGLWLYALLASWLPGEAHGHHSLFLKSFSVFSSKVFERSLLQFLFFQLLRFPLSAKKLRAAEKEMQIRPIMMSQKGRDKPKKWPLTPLPSSLSSPDMSPCQSMTVTEPRLPRLM